METYVRGFSCMPLVPKDIPVDVMDLQYIEGGELERSWKMNRRQRLKDQEQKIWEEFVKEQDVVQKAIEEDPYQFLHELPQTCLEELMESELQKIKKETEQDPIVEQPNQGEGDPPIDTQAFHTVTFAEESDKDDGNMFHIFDDENDLIEDVSGPENDGLDSPSTVREIHSENSLLAPTDKVSVKSSENVTTLIESSINCARVRDLRLKINEELQGIMVALECQDVAAMEGEDVLRKSRRATEFYNRYNRIYLYQLQKQVHDMRRAPSAPSAAALHQRVLHAAQVLSAALPTPLCLRGACSALRGVAGAARAASAAAPVPRDAPAAADLYDDELSATFEQLEETVNRYEARVADFLRPFEEIPVKNTNTPPSVKSNNKRGKPKKKVQNPLGNPKPTTKLCTSRESDGRLSMYSLDRLRINLHPKSTNSKENHSRPARDAAPDAALKGPKSLKKSPTAMPTPHPKRLASPRGRAPGGRAPRDSPSPGSPSRGSPPRSSPWLPSKKLSNRNEAQCTLANISALRLTAKKGSEVDKDNEHPRNVLSPRDGRSKDILEDKDCLNFAKGSSTDKDRSHHEKEGTWHGVGPSRNIGKQIGHIGNPGKEDTYTGPECSAAGFEDSNACRNSPKQSVYEDPRSEREMDKVLNMAPAGCEVTRLLRQLCSGDACGSRSERVTGAKNAQLLCINGTTSRQPSTPQLLRILEETIQKKTPRPMYKKTNRDPDRFRLSFNIAEKTADQMFQYRTKFVQHMLTSPMYANSAVGKPWEMVGSVSEKIIDDVLMACAKEMEIKGVIQELYKCETN